MIGSSKSGRRPLRARFTRATGTNDILTEDSLIYNHFRFSGSCPTTRPTLAANRSARSVSFLGRRSCACASITVYSPFGDGICLTSVKQRIYSVTRSSRCCKHISQSRKFIKNGLRSLYFPLFWYF